MKIKTIEARNFKGRDFAYDLDAMNLILGENFSGKTSVIDAIRLALMGNLPELGKLPSATWQLSSGQDMVVSVTFDTGENVSLVATMSGGKIKLRRNSAHDYSAIPLLDASAYFAMTERDRYDYVFRMATMPEIFTAKNVMFDIEGIGFESESREIEDAHDRIAHTVEVALGSTEKIQDGITDAIEKLKELFTSWNARAKDTQGAVRTLTELKNRQAAMVGSVLEFREAEKLARLTADGAYKHLADLEAQRQWSAMRERSKARVDELEKLVKDTSEVERLEGLIKEATATMRGIGKPRMVAEPAVDEHQLARWEVELAQILREEARYGSLIEENKTERELVKNMTECPYCKASNKGWKAHLEARLTERITHFQEDKTKVDGRIAVVKRHVEEAHKDQARARVDLEYNKEINGKILAWQTQIDAAERDRPKWQAQIDKERAAMGVEPEPVTAGQIEDATRAAKLTREEHETAAGKLRGAELLEHDLKRAAQAQLEHEKAEAYVTVIRAVRQMLEDKKAAMVEYVFGNLLSIANDIVGDVLTTTLAFYQGDIGRWWNGMFITHRTFSGTEQVLTFVAIAAALSQQSPIRLLIFDELGRLDFKRRGMLIDLLRRAVKNNYIDQFIVAGAVDREGMRVLSSDIKVIEL